MGSADVETLVSNALIKTVADLYQLNVNQLSRLDRFAQKSAQNLIRAIEESKKQSLERLIFALGIPFVGITAARILAEHFGKISALQNADITTLEGINGIGQKMAESIVTFFNLSSNKLLIERLQAAGIYPIQSVKSESTEFQDYTFVITGTLADMTREEAANEIRLRGGKVSSSVNKSTSYLVVGDKPGSKLKKARDLNIDILDEETFKKRLSK